MHFFVPMANDPMHARARYDQIRNRVGSEAEPIRIFRIRFTDNGRPLSLAVGDSYHGLNGDPVLAIFKADSSYLVCTPRHGAVEGEPIRVEQTAITTVEEFDS